MQISFALHEAIRKGFAVQSLGLNRIKRNALQLVLLSARAFVINDDFSQHHRHSEHVLNLGFGENAVATRLRDQHTQHTSAAQDRHAEESLKLILSRFGAIGKQRMARRVIQIKRPRR